MKVSLFFVGLSVAHVAAAANVESQNDEFLFSLDIMNQFHRWSNRFHKEYDSHAEKMRRMRIWVDNHERIEEHNNKIPKPTFTLGHNPFSDMTSDEFAQYFRLAEHSNVQHKFAVENEASTSRRLFEQVIDPSPLHLPDYVDWRQLGAVTDVKNQGACGSCWAFSTTGALEGAKFIKTGELVPLSEQNLLDCDHTDLGCNGGLMDNAFKFDEKSGGLCAESDYPYEAVQHDSCRTDCTDVPGTIVKTFVDVPPGDEKALLSAVAMQPISVAIEASGFVFQFYHGGVITDDSCGTHANVDHGVLAVGYGTDLDTNHPYFIIKNSWGEQWGENGYVKLGRNSTNEFGMCAVLKMSSFPVVE